MAQIGGKASDALTQRDAQLLIRLPCQTSMLLERELGGRR